MRTNPPLRTAILAAALVVFLALPSPASAGQVVPPGNSAATQYTQVFPTSGGNVAVGTSIGEAGHGAKRKPSQVIGARTARQLESQGREGRAVAQLAAESAPAPAAEPEAGTGAGAAAAGGNGNGTAGGGTAGRAADGSGAGTGAQAGARQAGPDGAGAATRTDGTAAAAGPGSSGVSEVLGQATGASSGQTGALLPIVLLAALVLALAYAWWRRQHPEQKAAP